MHHLSRIADVQVVTPASSIMDQHPALQPSKSRRTANRLNSSDLVALGKIFLSEIELPRPHVIADGWYGSVSAPSRERVLTAPWPTEDITSLYILAHEIAHWNMHFEWVPAGFWLGRAEIPSYRKEYEAELFAHNMLRRYGIAVPRQETIDARENVRYHLRRFTRFTIQPPDDAICQWARFDVDVERRTEWGILALHALKPNRDTEAFADIVIQPVRGYLAPDTQVTFLARSTRAIAWADKVFGKASISNRSGIKLYNALGAKLFWIIEDLRTQPFIVCRQR